MVLSILFHHLSCSSQRQDAEKINSWLNNTSPINDYSLLSTSWSSISHIIEGFLDSSGGCFNILSLLHIMRDEDKMMVMIHNALTNSSYKLCPGAEKLWYQLYPRDQGLLLRYNLVNWTRRDDVVIPRHSPRAITQIISLSFPHNYTNAFLS